ncbi:MAG: hypothetical protein RPS47_02735 [Colwellia sp.]|jgi:hypothetical protein
MINHKPTDVAPKLWVEVVVFITAYYPLFLILLIRDISNNTNEGVMIGFSGGVITLAAGHYHCF